MTKTRRAAALLLAATTIIAAPAAARPLLLISIDAMNPEYVTQAEQHGFDLPNLRRFISEGSHASGVRGVVPTITCPSHATLVTGVSPSRHGITGNDPLVAEGFSSSMCTFAADITADTLWDAAHRAGMTSGSVGWLNTAGSRAITWNLPHVEPYQSAATVKFQAAMARPEGLLDDMQARLGSFYQASDIAGSTLRTRYAVDILQRHQPEFMLVHMVSLDAAAHANGPFTAEAKAAVEAEDRLVGQLIDAALANDPDTVVAVVSDHGQAPFTRALNLRVPLVAAGLITIKEPVPGRAVKVTDRKLDVWGQAIKLTDPGDAATRAQVAALLHRLAADPANGIARVIEGEEVEALGGWPGAQFVIDMQPGTVIGGMYLGEQVTTFPTTRGHHGYLPGTPGMDASFFIKGTGIAAGRDLGVVDMRQIAPTLAQVMGVTLKDADQPALPVAATR